MRSGDVNNGARLVILSVAGYRVWCDIYYLVKCPDEINEAQVPPLKTLYFRSETSALPLQGGRLGKESPKLFGK